MRASEPRGKEEERRLRCSLANCAGARGSGNYYGRSVVAGMDEWRRVYTDCIGLLEIALHGFFYARILVHRK